MKAGWRDAPVALWNSVGAFKQDFPIILHVKISKKKAGEI